MRRDTSIEATQEDPRRGECSHPHSHFRLVLGSLSESVQPALHFLHGVFVLLLLLLLLLLFSTNSHYAMNFQQNTLILVSLNR